MLTPHFRDRVCERIGGVDPLYLAEELATAIDTGRDDYVERVCRTNAGTVYRFRIQGRGEFFAIRADTGKWITVLLAGFTVRRKGGKREKRLNARYDIAAE